MTIKEWIIKNEIKFSEERLEKLIEIEAPQIIIESQKNQVEELKSGILRIGGAIEKLDNEMVGFEQKKGRGGKIYIEFTDGTRYFPNAQYGRFIA